MIALCCFCFLWFFFCIFISLSLLTHIITTVDYIKLVLIYSSYTHRWWYNTKRISSSSHWKLTCSRHDIAEKLPSWRQTTITHYTHARVRCRLLLIWVIIYVCYGNLEKNNTANYLMCMWVLNIFEYYGKFYENNDVDCKSTTNDTWHKVFFISFLE